MSASSLGGGGASGPPSTPNEDVANRGHINVSGFLRGEEPESDFFSSATRTREDAEKELKDTPQGTFLVRKSPHLGAFVLSVRATDLRIVLHVRIQTKDRKYSWPGFNSFDSLIEFCQFYSEHALPRINIVLTHGVWTDDGYGNKRTFPGPGVSERSVHTTHVKDPDVYDKRGFAGKDNLVAQQEGPNQKITLEPDVDQAVGLQIREERAANGDVADAVAGASSTATTVPPSSAGSGGGGGGIRPQRPPRVSISSSSGAAAAGLVGGNLNAVLEGYDCGELAEAGLLMHRESSDSTAKLRHIFLYERMLLVCKLKGKSYNVKGMVQLDGQTDVRDIALHSLPEQHGGAGKDSSWHGCSFGVSLGPSKPSHILSAHSLSDKKRWTAAITTCLNVIKGIVSADGTLVAGDIKSTEEDSATALTVYEHHVKLPAGCATIDQVVATSAGVQGLDSTHGRQIREGPNQKITLEPDVGQAVGLQIREERAANGDVDDAVAGASSTATTVPPSSAGSGGGGGGGGSSATPSAAATVVVETENFYSISGDANADAGAAAATGAGAGAGAGAATATAAAAAAAASAANEYANFGINLDGETNLPAPPTTPRSEANGHTEPVNEEKYEIPTLLNAPSEDPSKHYYSMIDEKSVPFPPVPFTDEDIATALTVYEQQFDLPVGSATIGQVVANSAGLRSLLDSALGRQISKDKAANVGSGGGGGGGGIRPQRPPRGGALVAGDITYDTTKVLGNGHYGTVVKGMVNGKEEVAVKVAKIPQPEAGVVWTESKTLREKELVAIGMRAEIELMADLQKNGGGHLNVIKMVAAFMPTGTGAMPMLATEFCEGGTLEQASKDARPPEKNQVWLDKVETSFALQIAKGMEYMEMHQVVHRDLACRNILIHGDGVAKISDFGLARKVTSDGKYRMNQYNNWDSFEFAWKWMAIESLEDEIFTSKSDVWSFGIVLAEMCMYGGMPYPGTISSAALIQLLKEGGRHVIRNDCPLVLQRMMRQCWQDDPEKRPTFAQVVQQLERRVQQLSVHTRLQVAAEHQAPAPQRSRALSHGDLEQPGANKGHDYRPRAHSANANLADIVEPGFEGGGGGGAAAATGAPAGQAPQAVGTNPFAPQLAASSVTSAAPTQQAAPFQATCAWVNSSKGKCGNRPKSGKQHCVRHQCTTCDKGRPSGGLCAGGSCDACKAIVADAVDPSYVMLHEPFGEAPEE